jgi:hypothetical protein
VGPVLLLYLVFLLCGVPNVGNQKLGKRTNQKAGYKKKQQIVESKD